MARWPDADYAVESLGDVVRISILAGDDANSEGATELLLKRYSGREELAVHEKVRVFSVWCSG